jgi:hypothetical protein
MTATHSPAFPGDHPLAGLLSEREAADILDLHPLTLLRYRRSGRGPEYSQIGRTIYYTPSALRAWAHGGGNRRK